MIIILNIWNDNFTKNNMLYDFNTRNMEENTSKKPEKPWKYRFLGIFSWFGYFFKYHWGIMYDGRQLRWSGSDQPTDPQVVCSKPSDVSFSQNTFLTVASCVTHVNNWIEKTLTTLTSLRGRFRTESGVVDARLFPEGTFVCPQGWGIDDIWLGPGGFVTLDWIECSSYYEGKT